MGLIDRLRRLIHTVQTVPSVSDDAAYAMWQKDLSCQGFFVVEDDRIRFFLGENDARKHLQQRKEFLVRNHQSAVLEMFRCCIPDGWRLRFTSLGECCEYIRERGFLDGQYPEIMEILDGGELACPVYEVHLMRLSSGQFTGTYVYGQTAYTTFFNISLRDGQPFAGVEYDEETDCFRRFLPVSQRVWEKAVEEFVPFLGMGKSAAGHYIRENLAMCDDTVAGISRFKATEGAQLLPSSSIRSRRLVDERLRRDYPLGLRLYHSLSAQSLCEARQSGGRIGSQEGLCCTMVTFTLNRASAYQEKVVEITVPVDAYSRLEPDAGMFLFPEDGEDSEGSVYSNFAGVDDMAGCIVWYMDTVNLFSMPGLRIWNTDDILVHTGQVESFRNLLERMCEAPQDLRPHAWYEKAYVLRTGLLAARRSAQQDDGRFFLEDAKLRNPSVNPLSGWVEKVDGQIFLTQSRAMLEHLDRYLSALETGPAIEPVTFCELAGRFITVCAASYARGKVPDMKDEVITPMLSNMERIAPLIGGVDWDSLPEIAARPRDEKEACISEILYAIYKNPSLVERIRRDFFISNRLYQLVDLSGMPAERISLLSLQLLSERIYPARGQRREVIRMLLDPGEALCLFSRKEYRGLASCYPASFLMRYPSAIPLTQFVEVSSREDLTLVFHCLYDDGIIPASLEECLSVEEFARGIWGENEDSQGMLVSLRTGECLARDDVRLERADPADIIPFRLVEQRQGGRWVMVESQFDMEHIAEGRRLESSGFAFPFLLHTASGEVLPALKSQVVDWIAFRDYDNGISSQPLAPQEGSGLPFPGSLFPGMLYHGDNLDTTRIHREPCGIFFVSDRRLAQSLSENGHVISAYIDVRNPFTLDCSRLSANEILVETGKVKDAGFDGVICRNMADGRTLSEQIVVFDPARIRVVESSDYHADRSSMAGTARRITGISHEGGVISYSAFLSLRGETLGLCFRMDRDGHFLDVRSRDGENFLDMFSGVGPDAIFGPGTQSRLKIAACCTIDLDFYSSAFPLPLDVECRTAEEWEMVSSYARISGMGNNPAPSFPARFRLSYAWQEGQQSQGRIRADQLKAVSGLCCATRQEKAAVISAVMPDIYRTDIPIRLEKPFVTVMPDGGIHSWDHFRLSGEEVILESRLKGSSPLSASFLMENLDLTQIETIRVLSVRLHYLNSLLETVDRVRKNQGASAGGYPLPVELSCMLAFTSSYEALEESLRMDGLSDNKDVFERLCSLRESFGLYCVPLQSLPDLGKEHRTWIARAALKGQSEELFLPVPEEIAKLCPGLAFCYNQGMRLEYTALASHIHDALKVTSTSMVVDGLTGSLSGVLTGNEASKIFEESRAKGENPSGRGIFLNRKVYTAFRDGQAGEFRSPFAAYLFLFRNLGREHSLRLERSLVQVPARFNSVIKTMEVTLSQHLSILEFSVKQKDNSEFKGRLRLDAMTCDPVLFMEGSVERILSSLIEMADLSESLEGHQESRTFLPSCYRVRVENPAQLELVTRFQSRRGLLPSHVEDYPSEVLIDKDYKGNDFQVISIQDFMIYGLCPRLCENDLLSLSQEIQVLAGEMNSLRLSRAVRVFTEQGSGWYDTVVFGRIPYLENSKGHTGPHPDISYLSTARLAEVLDCLEETNGLHDEEYHLLMHEGIDFQGETYRIKREGSGTYSLYDGDGEKASAHGLRLSQVQGCLKEALLLTLMDYALGRSVEQIMESKHLCYVPLDLPVLLPDITCQAYVTGVSLERFGTGESSGLLHGYLSLESGVQYDVLLDSLPEELQHKVRIAARNYAVGAVSPGCGGIYGGIKPGHNEIHSSATLQDELIVRMRERGLVRMSFSKPFTLRMEETCLLRSFFHESTGDGLSVRIEGEMLDGKQKGSHFGIQLADLGRDVFPAVVNEMFLSIGLYPVLSSELGMEETLGASEIRCRQAVSEMLSSSMEQRGVSIMSFDPPFAVLDMEISSIRRSGRRVLVSALDMEGRQEESDLCLFGKDEVNLICEKCSTVFHDESIVESARIRQELADVQEKIKEEGGRMSVMNKGKEYVLSIREETVFLDSCDGKPFALPLEGRDAAMIADVVEAVRLFRKLVTSEDYFRKDDGAFVYFRKENGRFLYSFGLSADDCVEFDLTLACNFLAEKYHAVFSGEGWDDQTYLNFLHCRPARIPTAERTLVECSLYRENAIHRARVSKECSKNDEGPASRIVC